LAAYLALITDFHLTICSSSGHFCCCHNMSAAEHVFSLPELVQIIIEHLEFDRATLYSAHLVNTTRAEYANKALWRNAPLSSLSAIEPARQQHYANLIKNSFS
jgi:hypothetical protein